MKIQSDDEEFPTVIWEEDGALHWSITGSRIAGSPMFCYCHHCFCHFPAVRSSPWRLVGWNPTYSPIVTCIPDSVCSCWNGVRRCQLFCRPESQRVDSTLPHIMSSLGPHWTLFLLKTGPLFVTEFSGPSVPYLPASTPPVASPGLDYAPFYPSMFNLLAAFIAPSPTFDSISPEASLHPASSGIPISLGLSQSGISSIHHSTLDNNPNPTSFQGSFPIPSGIFNSLAVNPWNSSPSP